MNPSAAVGMAKNLIYNHGRTATTLLAGAAGRSAGVQLGPQAVNAFINWTVKGAVTKFFLRNATHAAIGGGYAWLGQAAFTLGAYYSPDPVLLMRKCVAYKHDRDYRNQLKTFDPEALTARAIKEGWLLCDDLQKKPPIIEDYVDMQSYEQVDDEDAKGLPKTGVMGPLRPVEMDDLKSRVSAEGFVFVNKREIA
ncbi:hypothetical protein EZMO1_1199 [Endozoicomonas montiporae CL-33]|nr:hypothetical protein EZMO1_1199 [Endozoicomonas montiporae CL-33]